MTKVKHKQTEHHRISNHSPPKRRATDTKYWRELQRVGSNIVIYLLLSRLLKRQTVQMQLHFVGKSKPTSQQWRVASSCKKIFLKSKNKPDKCVEAGDLMRWLETMQWARKWLANMSISFQLAAKLKTTLQSDENTDYRFFWLSKWLKFNTLHTSETDVQVNSYNSDKVYETIRTTLYGPCTASMVGISRWQPSTVHLSGDWPDTQLLCAG